MSEIMDVTLRDGSYAINFQFSTADVEMIGRELDELGYSYIEIGHGMGLGASSERNGMALNTDAEYLRAAQNSICKAKYGMFCIPEVATLDDIKRATEFGMKFIRIGTNVDQIHLSEKYIQEAKKCGLMVMANYMKSYAMKPDEFAVQVKKSESYGADVVYIVDSAGSMMPDDIENYFTAVRAVSNIKLGFHGHDNLGLALSNSLFAEKLGYDFIDTSMQGLGRSAGNASTELFTICSMKNGVKREVDYKRLLLFSQKIIYPLLSRKGINPIDTICGVAGFHTSYLKVIHRISAKYKVDSLELIEKYCEIDQLGMNEKLLEELAKDLKKNASEMINTNFIHYFGNEQC